MRPVLKAKKMLILCAGVVAFGLMPMSASAITEEELKQEALKERIEDYGKRLEFLERFTWNGDFRLRHEGFHESTFGEQDNDRDRIRIRFRLQGNVHMEQDLDVGFRFVTGDSGSTSANETLTGTFNNKTLDIDRAFFNWSPGDFEVVGGKMALPFMASEVIWDDDVNPEGLAETYSRSFGDTTMKFVAGQFIVDESASQTDIKLWAFQGQVGQKTSFGDFALAVAYYDYDGLGHDTGNAVTPTAGLERLSAGSEVKDVDVMVEWSNKVFGQKLKVFGEYVENVGTIANQNQPLGDDLTTAWQVGAKYGKSGKKFLDWDAKVIYRVTQADAVFDALADSDFHQGNSNSRGIEAGFSIGLTKGAQLAYGYFNTREDQGAYTARQTHQIDFKFKF